MALVLSFLLTLEGLGAGMMKEEGVGAEVPGSVNGQVPLWPQCPVCGLHTQPVLYGPNRISRSQHPGAVTTQDWGRTTSEPSSV